MPTDPTLTISIDRTGMTGSPAPLVLHGNRGTGSLGITDYTEPAMQPRGRDAPTADDLDGETTTAWSWQETMLVFEVVTDVSASEADSRSLIAELRAAITRLNVPVTVTVGDAPAETWRGKLGTLTPTGPRNRWDLAKHNPTWTVTIRCHPIRSVA
jgi:hypothetical protein